MKFSIWGYAFALCLVGRAIASPTLNAELTGLADFGSIHLACVKLGQAEGFTLHPGETVSGITLKEINAKEGWALFKDGTNEFRLRLANYCTASTTTVAASALGKPSAPSRPKPRGSQPNGVQAAEESAPESSSPFNDAVAQSGSEPVVPPAGLTLPYLPSEPMPKGAPTGPQASTSPTPDAASGSPTSQPSQPSPPSDVASSTPGQNGPQPNNNSGSDNADTVSTGGVASGGHHVTSDPQDPQGAQILMYYGRAAYLAWDIQRWRRLNGQ